MQVPLATLEDRAHFCTGAQAFIAIPDVLPFRSNGRMHVARNVTTGHAIPCADAYMATGYVAGSAALFPQWVFVLEMGDERVKCIKAHPQFSYRMKNPNWREFELQKAEAATEHKKRKLAAQAAYDNVMQFGAPEVSDY